MNTNLNRFVLKEALKDITKVRCANGTEVISMEYKKPMMGFGHINVKLKGFKGTFRYKTDGTLIAATADQSKNYKLHLI